jgi:DNA-binding response OmpR family regulator
MGQRILVVDDDREIVRLLRGYLEQAAYEVMCAYDGETALHILRREHPDLAVLDLMLPDRDGWEITRIVRSDPTLAELPIIMLTARVEEADRIVGLELGADDYVTKPFSPRELVARVRATLRRVDGQMEPPSIIRAGEIELDSDSLEATVAGRPVELTGTEFQFLAALARQPGRIFSREQLLEAVHGVSFDGYDRSVDSHIKNIRRKIEPDPRHPRYIQTVYGIGYRLADR